MRPRRWEDGVHLTGNRPSGLRLPRSSTISCGLCFWRKRWYGFPSWRNEERWGQAAGPRRDAQRSALLPRAGQAHGLVQRSHLRGNGARFYPSHRLSDATHGNRGARGLRETRAPLRRGAVALLRPPAGRLISPTLRPSQGAAGSGLTREEFWMRLCSYHDAGYILGTSRCVARVRALRVVEQKRAC